MRSRPRSSSAAFTLIEIVVVIVIILILAGIVVGLSGYVNGRAYRARAEAEIAMFKAALDSYKAETGGYPEDLTATLTTSKLSPKQHFNPMSTEYEKSSLYLYKELTGDKDANGIPDTNEPMYLKQFERKKIVMMNGAGTLVRGFQDPWGYFYGYSTAGLSQERKFENDLKTNPSAARPVGDLMLGFNISSFDLWSTAGSRPLNPITAPALMKQEWDKWVKSW